MSAEVKKPVGDTTKKNVADRASARKAASDSGNAIRDWQFQVGYADGDHNTINVNAKPNKKAELFFIKSRNALTTITEARGFNPKGKTIKYGVLLSLVGADNLIPISILCDTTGVPAVEALKGRVRKAIQTSITASKGTFSESFCSPFISCWHWLPGNESGSDMYLASILAEGKTF